MLAIRRAVRGQGTGAEGRLKFDLAVLDERAQIKTNEHDQPDRPISGPPAGIELARHPGGAQRGDLVGIFEFLMPGHLAR